MAQVIRDPDTGEQFLIIGEKRLSFSMLGQINQKMRDPSTGVSIKDRKWRLREYKQCFVGKELVDWFINEKIVGTREEAVILGNFYLEHNIFTHVVKEHKFEDKELFYVFEDINKSRQIFEVPSRNRSNFTEVSPLEKSATSTSGQMETTTSTSSNSSLTTPNNTISTSSSNSSPFTSEAPQNKEPKQERVRVAEKCAVCSYPLQPEWKFCPMCATVIPKDEVLNIYAHVDTSVTAVFEDEIQPPSSPPPHPQSQQQQQQTQQQKLEVSAPSTNDKIQSLNTTPASDTQTQQQTASPSTTEPSLPSQNSLTTQQKEDRYKHVHSLEGAKIAKDKNALPTKEGEVIVIKTTYGENPHIRKNKILPPTERKYIPTTSAPGVEEGESFDRLVVENLHYENAKGPIQAMFTGIEKRPESSGSSRMVTFFRIDVFRGGLKWTIFRRVKQFKELDKKLKSNKLLKSNDHNFPSLGPLTDEETKRIGLEKYLHYLLTNDETAQCDVVVAFLSPIQMNDIKPGQEPSTQEKKEKAHVN